MEEVGQKLRDARTQAGMSLDDVAAATRIPKVSLARLEEGRYELLPAPVFVRGFIRAYARAVQLDPNPLVRLFESRHAELGRSAPTASDAPLSAAAARVGAVGRRLGYGPADEPAPARELDKQTRGPRLDPAEKLVPLQPVSMRSEGGLRGGFMLIAVAAAGLLIAAWVLVGQKKSGSDGAAQIPTAPVIHERIDGMPSFDAAPAPGGPSIFGEPLDTRRPSGDGRAGVR
jgi:transcriptional regulator with XRE-family HTH domain